MAGVTASFSSPDLTKQIQLLGPVHVNKVVNKEGMTAMRTSTMQMFTGWQGVAAIDTSHYRNTLKMEIKSLAGGRIIQGAVRTFAISPAGFPYPRALEDSARYHYRSTKRQGQRTAGRVVKMFQLKLPEVNKLFIKANDNIVKSLVVK